MIYTITDTTDGHFIGESFDPDFPIVLSADFTFVPDRPRQITGPCTVRFSNSNYIVETTTEDA